MSDVFIRFHFYLLKYSVRVIFVYLLQGKGRRKIYISVEKNVTQVTARTSQKECIKAKFFSFYFIIAFGDLTVFHISFRDYHFSLARSLSLQNIWDFFAAPSSPAFRHVARKTNKTNEAVVKCRSLKCKILGYDLFSVYSCLHCFVSC